MRLITSSSFTWTWKNGRDCKYEEMDIKFLKNLPKADVIIDMKENKINIV